MCGTNPLNFDLWFYSGDIPCSNKTTIRRIELYRPSTHVHSGHNTATRDQRGLDAAQTLYTAPLVPAGGLNLVIHSDRPGHDSRPGGGSLSIHNHPTGLNSIFSSIAIKAATRDPAPRTWVYTITRLHYRHSAARADTVARVDMAASVDSQTWRTANKSLGL